MKDTDTVPPVSCSLTHCTLSIVRLYNWPWPIPNCRLQAVLPNTSLQGPASMDRNAKYYSRLSFSVCNFLQFHQFHSTSSPSQPHIFLPKSLVLELPYPHLSSSQRHDTNCARAWVSYTVFILPLAAQVLCMTTPGPSARTGHPLA